MWKHKSGQALVEFVIILPIFIFMIMAVIDIGKILYFENNLESKMEEVVTLVDANYSKNSVEEKLKLEEENTTLNLEEHENFLELVLEKETTILTPGLNLILKNPFKMTTKRVIYNE